MAKMAILATISVEVANRFTRTLCSRFGDTSLLQHLIDILSLSQKSALTQAPQSV